MSDTTWVALITASSTLLASTITGLVAYLAGRRQAASQEIIAHTQIVEARNAQYRDLRRAAYVGALNQHSIVERTMKNAWEATPCIDLTEPDGYRELEDALNLLQEKLHLVELEGPLEIAAHAADIMAFEMRSMSTLSNLLKDHANSPEVPSRHDREKARREEFKRIDVRDAFIRAARDVLGSSF
ncbi:hypothetical protein [Streptomyces lydicus]|uniref:hypothetical protein n=1 Tax=Streptomyces lydicus TaxID=47763 RepID=UPI0037D5F46C